MSKNACLNREGFTLLHGRMRWGPKVYSGKTAEVRRLRRRKRAQEIHCEGRVYGRNGGCKR